MADDDKELKDQRVVTMMSSSELDAIDDWMFKNRIRSRGEAIRRLCQMAMLTDRRISPVIARLIDGATARSEKLADVRTTFKRMELETTNLFHEFMQMEIFVSDLHLALLRSLTATEVAVSQLKAPDTINATPKRANLISEYLDKHHDPESNGAYERFEEFLSTLGRTESTQPDE